MGYETLQLPQNVTDCHFTASFTAGLWWLLQSLLVYLRITWIKIIFIEFFSML